LRIVLATTADGPGGVWRHVNDLALGLLDRGVDVRLALRPSAKALQERASAAGLVWRTLSRALLQPTDLWHVHLHNTMDRRAFALTALLVASRRPTVLTEHLPRAPQSDPSLPYGPDDDVQRRRPYAQRLKGVAKRSQLRRARVICVSRASADFLVVRYGIDRSAIRVVHNGVPPAPDAPFPPGPMKVVSIGAVGWRKGHDVLVDAARLAQRPWTATIVGEGDELGPLMRQAETVAPDRIIFAGWHQDVGPFLRDAHVFCLLSRWEAHPYGPLEAMAAGRPVVVSEVDGMPEIVADGRAGWLVPVGSPRELAQTLDRLSGDLPAVIDRGSSARATAASHFGLTNMIEGTIDVYREALRRG
jgi:glycosyltransferase involved in cell wall biosynthesis